MLIFKTLFQVTIWFILIYLVIFSIIFCEGAVIRSQLNDTQESSPYYKAFSSIDRSRIAEYERLKRSLMYFKPIDWNVVVQPRIRESDDSSS